LKGPPSYHLQRHRGSPPWRSIVRARLVAPPAISLIGMVEAGGCGGNNARVTRRPSNAWSTSCRQGSCRDDAAVRERGAPCACGRVLNERFGKRPFVEIHVVRILTVRYRRDDRTASIISRSWWPDLSGCGARCITRCSAPRVSEPIPPAGSRRYGGVRRTAEHQDRASLSRSAPLRRCAVFLERNPGGRKSTTSATRSTTSWPGARPAPAPQAQGLLGDGEPQFGRT